MLTLTIAQVYISVRWRGC